MKKFKYVTALVICIIMLLSVNTSVFGAVLDTVESPETVSGYRMGAFRIIDSAFTWKGMSHTHMIMTTAVRTSDNKGYTGFCLNAGKYWGENSSISISSDSQLDPADAKNKEIIKAVNYWCKNIFTDNGSIIDASKITPAIALKYAVIQCYIWGIIEDDTFASKDTAAQAAEIAATLGGKNFGSSYYGYTVQSENTVLAEAQTLIVAIKSHNPTIYTDVLVSESSGNQDAAFIISDRRMEEYGDILVYKTDSYDNPLQHITFSVYSDRLCTQYVTTGVTDIDGKLTFKNLVANRTYYIREVGVGPNGVVLVDTIYPVTVAANTTTEAGAGKIVNENRKGSVEITKRDENGVMLDGAEFTVYEWTGFDYSNKVGTLTESSTGVYTISGLAWTPINQGRFEVVETKSPDGYCGGWIQEIQISENNIVIGIQAYNESTKVKVSKKSITSQDELPGAALQIIDKSGEVVEEWISTTEPYYIEAKLIAGATYTLREIIAPDGYMVANDIEFVVDPDGTVTEVVMFDEAEPELIIPPVSITPEPDEPEMSVTPEPDEPEISATPEPDEPEIFVTPEPKDPIIPATPAVPDTPATGDEFNFVCVVIAVFALVTVSVIRRIY